VRFSLWQALHCFKLIVDDHPDHYPAWILSGQVYDQLGMSGKAVESYGKALDLVPDHVELRLKMVKLLLEQNKQRQALNRLDQLAASQLQKPPANLYRVHAYLELGESEKARELLQASQVDPDADALAAYLQAQSLLAEGRHKEAEQWFRTALKLGPGAS